MAPPKPNAYSLFVGDEAQKRGVNKNTLFQSLGPVWQSMSEDAKQKYKDRANQLKFRIQNQPLGPPPSRQQQKESSRTQAGHHGHLEYNRNNDDNYPIAIQAASEDKNTTSETRGQNDDQSAFFPRPKLSLLQSTLDLAGPKVESNQNLVSEAKASTSASSQSSFFAAAKIKVEPSANTPQSFTKVETNCKRELQDDINPNYQHMPMESGDQVQDPERIVRHSPSPDPEQEQRGRKRIFDDVQYNNYSGALVAFDPPTPQDQSASNQLVVYGREAGEITQWAKRVKYAQNIPNARNIARGDVNDLDRYPMYSQFMLKKKANDLVKARSGRFFTFPLYTISCNILCKHHIKEEKYQWIPIEFGIYPYTLKSGRFKPSYKVLIDPGPPPAGSINKSRDHSEKCHKIPINQYPPEARTDYRDIYKEILEYTRDGEGTLLVADHREREQVVNALEWLHEKGREVDSGLTSTRVFNVLIFNEYLAAMHDVIHYEFLKNTTVRTGLIYDLKLRLDKCGDDWNTAYMCRFHARLKEPTRWCALSCATNLLKKLEDFLGELADMLMKYNGDLYRKITKQHNAAPPSRASPAAAPSATSWPTVNAQPFYISNNSNQTPTLAILSPQQANAAAATTLPTGPIPSCPPVMGPAHTPTRPMGPALIHSTNATTASHQIQPPKLTQTAPARPKRPEVKPFPHAIVD